MPTQDPGSCLYDYLLNPAVRGEFNRVLAAAKASADDGSKIIQDFFRRKYATTPAVFNFSKYDRRGSDQ